MTMAMPVMSSTDSRVAYLPQSLQASLQDEGAGTKELENLKLLESMGLEVFPCYLCPAASDVINDILQCVALPLLS